MLRLFKKGACCGANECFLHRKCTFSVFNSFVQVFFSNFVAQTKCSETNNNNIFIHILILSKQK